MRTIAKVAARLRPVSSRVNELMSLSVLKCSGAVNTVMMAVAIDLVGWIDTTLVENMVKGFVTIGECPDSGVYRAVVPAADHATWAARHLRFVSTAQSWNRALLSRLARRAHLTGTGRAADLAVALKTDAERKKGAVRGPFASVHDLTKSIRALSPQMPAGLVPRLMERFGIEQKGSIRAIDNGKSNLANLATRLYETVTTPTFAFPAIVARAFVVAALSSSSELLAAASPSTASTAPAMTVALADLTMAYRTVPTSQPWYTAFAFYNPTATPPAPEIYYTGGHNFGLTSAVVNFNRHPESVVIVARALLDVPVDHYYDDFIAVDLAHGGTTALSAVQCIVSAFGTPRHPRHLIRAPELDPDKTQHTDSSNTVLGVVADLSHVPAEGHVLFRPGRERIAAILEEFRAAFDRGYLLPAEASKLRGKLFFLLSTAYANIGRAATLPLVQRQYRDKTFEFEAGSELHHSLLFFEALLAPDTVTGQSVLPPLVVPVVPDGVPPLLVYSDASFFLRRARRRLSGACDEQRASRLGGGLGIVIYDPVDGTVRYAGGPPDWPSLLKFWPPDRKTYIAQLEVLAAVSAYFTYPEVFVGRKVNHFIDNTVALSALVHGYSGKRDLATMVNAFYLQLTGLRASVWFEYVPSKANIADLPSRDAWAELRAALAGIPRHPLDHGTLAVPSLADWNAPLASWATRHDHVRPSGISFPS